MTHKYCKIKCFKDILKCLLIFICFLVLPIKEVKADYIFGEESFYHFQVPKFEYDSKTKKIIVEIIPNVDNLYGVWADCYYGDNYKTKKYISIYRGACSDSDGKPNEKDALQKSAKIEKKIDAKDFQSGEYRCTVKGKSYLAPPNYNCVEHVDDETYKIKITASNSGDESEDKTEDKSEDKTEDKSEDKTEDKTEDKSEDDGDSQDSSSDECDSWGDAKRDMQNIFNFMKIIVPLLIIGLSTFDFIKAITQKDDKDIKKAFTRLMKRFVFAILLFFIPVILEFLLYLFEINNEICIK